MRLLFVNIFYSPLTYGGATIVVEEIAKILSMSSDIQPIVVSAGCREDIEPYTVTRVCTAGVENFIINLPKQRSFEENYSNPNVDKVFGRLLDDLRPGVVNIHCVQEIGAGVIDVIKQKEIPIILSTHDFWWVCERQFMINKKSEFCNQNKIKMQVCRYCFDNISSSRARAEFLLKQVKKCDLITYPSNYSKIIHVNAGFPSKNSVVWENGVNLPGEGFFRKQTERRQTSKDICFGYIGGPSHIKGWPLVRRAFHELALKHDNCKLVLVEGGLFDAWWRKDVLAFKGSKYEIVPRFSQNTIDDFYSKIDFLLFPSQWKETFGLCVREAISRGVGIIQTNSGGAVEHQAFNKENTLEIGEGPDRLYELMLKNLTSTNVLEPVGGVTSFESQSQKLREFINKF